MKLKSFLFVSLLFFPLIVIKSDVLASEPHLFLSPTSGNYSQNFNLEIKIDTGGQAAGGADVLLEFPKNFLSVQQVTKGTAFNEVFSLIKNEEGQLRIGAYFSYAESGKSYNGTDGLIATVNFKPIGNGTASVNFVCTPNLTNESNIVEKTTSKDIIVCNANINGSYNLTASASATVPTTTPTPTQIPTETLSTPTPTMPVTGSLAPTASILGTGVLILLTGLALIF